MVDHHKSVKILFPMLLLWADVTCFGFAESIDLPVDEHGDYTASDMIEWINSHHQGYVHPSLRIGRRIPGDPNSIIGTFVSSDAKAIEAGEIIATIPWDCIIGPGNEYSTSTFESCKAIHNLAAELKLGDKSQYKPYVNYLMTQSMKMMPAEWSDAAQTFLYNQILGAELPPFHADWFQAARYKDWLEDCRGNPNDALERFAFYLTSTRDEDTLMIPIYDMMNHSNDPNKLNTLSYKPTKAGDPFVFKASRRIEQSEEIFNCYNRCNVCSEHFREECETFSYRGTPDIFAHYGFVEEFPHYWWFERQTDNGIVEIEFCLEKTEITGKWEVIWIGSTPSDADMAHYTQHLERLERIKTEKHALGVQLVQSYEQDLSEGKMTRFEWDACWNYHDVLVTILSAVLDSIGKIKGGELENDINDEL